MDQVLILYYFTLWLSIITSVKKQQHFQSRFCASWIKYYEILGPEKWKEEEKYRFANREICFYLLPSCFSFSYFSSSSTPAISTHVIFSHFPMSEIRKLDFIDVTARACTENYPTDGVLASNRKFNLAISNPMTKVNSCCVYVTYTHFPPFPPSCNVEEATKLLKAEGIISLKVIDRVYVANLFCHRTFVIKSESSHHKYLAEFRFKFDCKHEMWHLDPSWLITFRFYAN